MRVLVTGGAGFIGSHLVDRFLQDGFKVRILDNLDPKIHPNPRQVRIPTNAEFIRGCVTDEAVLRRALENVDIVSHQAAYQDYMPEFSRFLSVNAVGTALIYELIIRDRLPVRKVIVASSQAVYGEGQYDCATHGLVLPAPRSQEQLRRGEWEVLCPECARPCVPRLLCELQTNPFNQYAVSKLAQERTALGLGWLYGIPTVALRYSITQGPRQSLFNLYSGVCRIFFSSALRKQPLTIYEDGLQTRDFVHVHDVVDANMLVLESYKADFQAYNVGGGKPVTVLEYARAVQATVPMSSDLEISGEYRRGDNRHSVSSIAKLQSLGWTPKRDLATILSDFLAWVLASGGIPAEAPDAYSDMKRSGVVLKAVSV